MVTNNKLSILEMLRATTDPNEAKVIYNMFKSMDKISDRTSSILTGEGEAEYVIEGHTLTLKYASGDVVSYTDPTPDEPWAPEPAFANIPHPARLS